MAGSGQHRADLERHLAALWEAFDATRSLPADPGPGGEQ
jgi:hypothetical protein